MRNRGASIAILFALVSIFPLAAVAVAVPVDQQASLQQQEPDIEADVELEGGATETTVWYADPFWIIVGIIAAIVVILLIVLAARGGGRGGVTVIKE